MEDITLWGFLAGLGLFLLGMFMMEQGLRGLGSRSMREFLRAQTSSPLRGVFTGTVVTSFLQSSSLVGLITLAFVGAGILELRNALGIILGSNLGTTFTGWVVTIIGFKLKLINYAQPLLALGALGTVFLNHTSRAYYVCNILLGLGLLLMGLSEMTNSFSILTSNVDASFFHGHSVLIYFFAGAAVTALIQSSSVAMMIVLSAMHAGAFTLQEAAPIVIGADLGTTSTVLLGSLKGSREKRRVALSHFFFNTVTDLSALLLMPVLLFIILNVFKMTDPLLSVVTFHSLFNVIGICLFLPFIDRFIKFLHWLLPDKEVEEKCVIINKVSAKVTDAAMEAVEQELKLLLIHCLTLNLRCFKVQASKVIPPGLKAAKTKNLQYEVDYADLKQTEGEMLGYTYLIQSDSEDRSELSKITRLNHAIRNAIYAAKFIKDIRHNLAECRRSSSEEIKGLHETFRTEVIIIYKHILRNLLNSSPELVTDHFTELHIYIRKSYERLIQDVYTSSGKDMITDLETSSLLNMNRSLYLSNMAMLESLSVLLGISEVELETIQTCTANEQ